jgi:hypothetical protein
MPRRTPTVLIEKTDSETYITEQVIECDGLYAVFYKGKPFNLRILNKLIDYPGPKYKKIAFPGVGHAYNLADRLNKLYNCDDFKVYKITTGEVCIEKKESDEQGTN